MRKFTSNFICILKYVGDEDLNAFAASYDIRKVTETLEQVNFGTSLENFGTSQQQNNAPTTVEQRSSKCNKTSQGLVKAWSRHLQNI